MVKKKEEAKDGIAGVGGVWKQSSEQQGKNIWRNQVVKFILQCQAMVNISHKMFRNWMQIKDQHFEIILRL